MFHFSHARVLYLVKEGKLKKENNPAQKKKKKQHQKTPLQNNSFFPA